MENVKEYLANAETAFSNRRYNEALTWYKKVLEETPDDIYVLSRAGAICVPLGNFDEALTYFQRAKELDPQNGDNIFNYANACFFSRNNVAAFEGYVEAERVGCSEEITPRLYYQLALICSMRNDFESALVYFKKCEEADKAGNISLNPDLISEKLKIYMVNEDFENADKCAAELVAIKPTDFNNYMVYFSLLMSHKKYSMAEKVLDDAQKYAVITEENQAVLWLQQAVVYMAMAEENPTEKELYIQKAITVLGEHVNDPALSKERKIEFLLTFAEVYQKAEAYDDSIYCLKYLLGEDTQTAQPMKTTDSTEESEVLSYEEAEAMISADLMRVQEKIYNGEIDSSMGLYAEHAYDEDGRLVNVYPENVFSQMIENTDDFFGKGEQFDLSDEVLDKVHFDLLTAYLAKEDFQSAKQSAEMLKKSKTLYYNYYGIYASVLSLKKIHGDTEEVRNEYAGALAFFRGKSFENPKDSLAVIFRARLYAEEGKFEKANELAMLLEEMDQKSLLDYIEECKKG